MTAHSAHAFPAENEILWNHFVDSADAATFAASWLALVCTAVDGTTGALILMGQADRGPYAPVAVWPDPARNMQHLVPAAEQALSGRRGVLTAPPAPTTPPARHIAYPLEVAGSLHGVAVFEIADRPEQHLQGVMRQIHWGAAWLEVLIRRSEAERDRCTIERLSTLIEITARCGRYDKFQQVALALVNELAVRLHCDRVALGVVRRGSVALSAVSNTSKLLKGSNLVKETEALMDEAVDQQACIVAPPPEPPPPLISRAHEEFLKRHELAGTCTVPLPGRKLPFGALTFERSAEPFDAGTLELLAGLGHLLGPILETHRDRERWFTAGLMRAPLRLMRKLAGPEAFALKATVAGLLVLLAALALIRTEYRVSSKTVIEGAVQRTLAAPFESYIASADARAGDLVRQGQLLCTLDNRDLALERRKWSTVGEQYSKKYRQSVANHERATALITDAQLKQAEAEAALLDQKLVRTRITAPFAGVLISGDLHQRLGSPVQQGEELFKIAPLDRYRVIVQVDERELGHVRVGEKGELVLASLPNDSFPFEVKRITPVTLSEEGKNHFRVEAQLLRSSDLLRPGMEGVGKIATGKQSLLWIWTHSVVDTVKLKLWSWMP